MQPGRSAAPAAPRTEPAAARSPQPGSGPAGAAKSGLERRSGAEAGRGGGGGAGLRCECGPPPRTGDPFGQRLRLPQGGAGVVGGEASHHPSQSPGTETGLWNPEWIAFPDPASPGSASRRTGGPGGAPGCGDPGAAPACGEQLDSGVPQAGSAAVPACTPASRLRSEVVSAPWFAAGGRLGLGDCRKGPGAQPARRSRQAPTVSPPAAPRQPGGLQGHAQQRGPRLS